MSIVKEFKEFAVKGNVVDLAVGLIIGAAFGKIVTSLVNDVIMPPIGLVLGNVAAVAVAVEGTPVELPTAAPGARLRVSLKGNGTVAGVR